MEGIKLDIEQNTPEWFATRFGKFTASNIYKLMAKSDVPGQVFSTAGLGYIYEVAYGRLLRNNITPAELGALIKRISIDNDATRWGREKEPEARAAYSAITGMATRGGAMYVHRDIDTFTASPDGIVGGNGIIEIKSPYDLKTVVRYALTVSDGPSLKIIEPRYYWQVQAQLEVTGAQWCDFVVYDPMLKDGVKVSRIYPRIFDAETMLERVVLAEEMVKNIIKQFNTLKDYEI